ncbi:NAD(P)/FAD-dependent oxidoreductase [[Clostridium] polysaccharolyticum]|uniref:Thioredoxin reductase (NADPH) n=1 Tax=[Clostridium] polysaccharolyticum TaxID=29364 RepID=A0A1I0EQ61_9FIRM|nr:NAD(P)/FAD-dependent oxidoreductase [[Clostridium] polysaccharolyticum]SET46923.1 thioredoxin reductase (NADPH) [[Clostridium] polysaccharolyticum]
MERIDIAIIGTGPAGISAAITAKVRNKNLMLIGKSSLSDKVSKAHQINNYPGLPAVKGEEFSKKFQEHLNDMKIAITDQRVSMVYPMGEYFGIQTSEGMLEATSVILAAGFAPDKTFKGENEFLGRGVSYCATCDAQFYKGKKAAVIGYNEESELEADYLAEIVEEVLYFPMYKKEPVVSKGVKVIYEKPVEIKGGMKVEQFVTAQNEYAVDGVFILREVISPVKLVPGLEMAGNHVKVNLQMETNIPGLFACGDIAGKPYQYIKAAGQGNVAALSAAAYLDALKRKNNHNQEEK